MFIWIYSMQEKHYHPCQVDLRWSPKGNSTCHKPDNNESKATTWQCLLTETDFHWQLHRLPCLLDLYSDFYLVSVLLVNIVWGEKKTVKDLSHLILVTVFWKANTVIPTGAFGKPLLYAEHCCGSERIIAFEKDIFFFFLRSFQPT